MISHGRRELQSLADRCDLEEADDANGWSVDVWRMDDGDVLAAIAAYDAVLAGGTDTDDPVLALLLTDGYDLNSLLTDNGSGKDDITRSDLTEYVAAATMVAADGCDLDRMHMPNIPKMARRKSDSGIDVFDVSLATSDAPELTAGDHLTIGSVKHTIDTSTSGMRYKLAASLSDAELSAPYLMQQLRVLNGRLLQEGQDPGVASRVYLFLRDFPAESFVALVGVAVTAPDLEGDLAHHVTLLPAVTGAKRTFRKVFLPGLRTVHERCT